MPGLDADSIRYALKTAREYGFRTVRLENEGDRFQATLSGQSAEEGITEDYRVEDPIEVSNGPSECEIRAPVVGYCGEVLVSVGKQVKSGEVVGSILALGLPSDVESPRDGEIVAVLVRQGEPLQYGQAIATLRTNS